MNTDSLLYINNNRISKKFDLVFLDPPYASNLLELALPMVRSIISENGLIYIEDNKNLAGLNSDLGLDLISKNNLAIYKHTKMGQIYAYLLKSAL
jgi:16S rRNA G966 N2-methylase RsmD